MVRHAFGGLGAAVLALLLVLRISDGSMSFLVQSWYQPILIASVVVLMILAVFVSAQALRSGGHWNFHARPAGLLTALLVAVPVVMGFAMKPKPLGSQSLGSGTSVSGAQQFSQTVSTAQPTRRNIYQWSYEFQTGDPKALVGQPVDVVGFVYHGKTDRADQFEVARFVVACCVADATGHTLLVQWPAAATLVQDSWVHVVGRVATAPGGAVEVQATSVAPVEAPSNPYIYP